jgi:hypothetical protein
VKLIKKIIFITTSSTFIFGVSYPVYAWFGVGNFVGDMAKKLGASKKVAEYISAGVDSSTGDPKGTGRLLIKSFSDAGIVGDADSCAAFSELTSTGAAAVAAAYSGGAAAGMAKTIGGKAMSEACAEQFGSPASGVEKAKQAYMQNAPSVPPEILNAQIQAGVRIVELQTQGKIEEAKILAKSALDVETTKQKGETERAIIQSQALLKMTAMNNAKDLEIARINLEATRDTNATDLAKTKDTNATDLAKTKIQTKAETIQTGIGAGAQLITALINTPKQPKEPPQNIQTQQIAVVHTDPTDALLRQWGWLKVSCTIGVVFIKGLNADTICVNPTSTMPAGEYIYDASTDQLQPVAIAPSITEIKNSSATDDEPESADAEESNTEQEGEE